MKKRIKLIYIAGMGRSGSTLLDLIISTNEKVFSVGEVYRFNDIMNRNALCACGENVSNCKIWQDLHCRKNSLKINDHTNFRDYLKIANRLCNSFAGRKKLFSGQNNFGLLKEIRDKASEDKSEYILDSSKEVGRLIELVEDGHFDVYCIHVVRRGENVANSYMSKHNAVSRNFCVTFLKWFAVNKLIDKFISKSGIKNIKISFERFCDNPRKSLQKVEKFLGIKIPSNYTEIIRDMDYHNIGGNRLSKQSVRKGFKGVLRNGKASRLPSRLINKQ